ncbi:uncharacterized protein LOC105662567 isoform X2 [Megachile rotundata]|uniref:uncharacterized protein LOC105662567 isoform X2 n=1 Tax=Megachile rotundata TaxID=143995 RepID=UPI000615002D|nr:PREDICTED: uncharacterized protein LOC105662567 isoform X2 [Megachile rotundata]XP_012141478.1 PREDICTED: uncharacterized protein LOC105662567 isoform X2 [Megachile rotundata]
MRKILRVRYTKYDGDMARKGGCSAFGHSCFGGHGKRFDSHLRDITFQRNEVPTSDNIQGTQDVPLYNQFEVPKQKFLGQREIFLEARRQPPVRLDNYILSSIFRQWLTSQHRHQPEMDINDK